MKTSLSHLPESKQQELKRVTQLIVETISPEKIILFGSYATDTWVEDRYTEGHITYEYISDYDLLVVTKAGERRKDHEITDQIKSRLRFRVPVNVITHDIEYVNRTLNEGQYFFIDIVKEGILLYDTGNIAFNEPKDLSPEERKEIAQRDFENWFSSAKEFLIDAKNAFERKSLKNSIFYLHQAAERIYNTVLLVFTGYKPKTHNLDKLRSLSKAYSSDLYLIFPCNTKEEEYLFSLLQKGYIDARYNNDFNVSAEELAILIERVDGLLFAAEKICKQQLEDF
ncbi:MAG TPA: HEPN domain-containing protein [Flavisolibacter sp.]|jgi:HEPN domain-containing protein/predicted nucleotidyltransferase|nr:HEPN domain-containing protein [Flavisolibacter sp.]